MTYEPHEYEFPRPAQPPKVERHPTEKLYLKHDLMYIRYDAPIERKENGKCKIGGTRPPYRQITRQPKYKPDGKPYYSLLMGREYKPGRFLMLLDIDNKDEEGTTNGL